MSRANICPVCGGCGRYAITPVGIEETTGGATQNANICHGCGGKGWVEVGIEIPQYPYQQPPWYPPFTISYGPTCGPAME